MSESNIYLDDPEVINFLKQIRENKKINTAEYSARYNHALETAGIRFASLGGTSAGAIVALLIAAIGKPEEKKGGRLLRYMSNVPFKGFMDGDRGVLRFIRTMLNRQAGWLRKIYSAFFIIDDIKKKWGLNPGDKFYDWLDSSLRAEGADTKTKLETKINSFPAANAIARRNRYF